MENSKQMSPLQAFNYLSNAIHQSGEVDAVTQLLGTAATEYHYPVSYSSAQRSAAVLLSYDETRKERLDTIVSDGNVIKTVRPTSPHILEFFETREKELRAITPREDKYTATDLDGIVKELLRDAHTADGVAKT